RAGTDRRIARSGRGRGRGGGGVKHSASRGARHGMPLPQGSRCSYRIPGGRNGPSMTKGEPKMPTEKKITLYQYHELSESAKERAREWYLSTLYWSEEVDHVLEHWRDLAEKLGFEIDRNGGPWWDLHYGSFEIGRGRFYRTLDSELDRLEQEYAHNPDILSIVHEVRAIPWDFSASIEDGKIESFDIAPDYDMEPENDDDEEGWDEYYKTLKALAEEG